jgi:prophage regulatory protein
MTSPSLNASETRILRLPEVLRRTGKRRSSLYADVRAGRFPKSVPLGARSVGWLSTDVDHWIADRIAQRKGAE